MPDERKLTDWLTSWMDYCENTEPPDMFKLWSGISVIAAALQRKVYIQWGMLEWFPNMYIILVGPSASRKTTAMMPGARMLSDIGIKPAADCTSLQALIKRLKERTGSSMVDGVMTFHSSLTVFSKEFTVFLGYQNRELIAALCDWYDCDRRWSYDTISRGEEEIIGVWLNLIGATTPDLLRAALPTDAIGSGLTSRIIFVCEPSKGKIVARPFQTEEEVQLGVHLQQDLEKINMLSGRFVASTEFVELWDKWYSNEAQRGKIFQDPRFDGYVGRRPTHLMKLSMILATSRADVWNKKYNRLVVLGQDFKRALSLLEATEVNMQGVFTGLGKSMISELIPKVMAEIAISGSVPFWKLQQQFYNDADKQTMERVLQTLESMRYIRINNKGSDGVWIELRDNNTLCQPLTKGDQNELS